MMTYPGQFCQSLNITTESIETRSVPNIENLSNGLALELKAYADTNGLNSFELLNIFSMIDSRFNDVNSTSLHSKLLRLVEQRKKFSSRKKVKGVKNVTELLDQKFAVPVPSKKNTVELGVQNSVSVTSNHDNELTCLEHLNFKDDISTPERSSVGSQTCDTQVTKESNFMLYENTKADKRNEQLKKQILESVAKLEKIKHRIGHYAIRNINKRDEKSKKNMQTLREAQRLSKKHRNQFQKMSAKFSQQQNVVKTITNEHKQLKDTICELFGENHELVIENQSEKCKKNALQKKNSYLKTELLKLRDEKSESSLANDNGDERLQEIVNTQEDKITNLEEQLEHVSTEEKKHKLKNTDGSYSNHVRLCIMELSGLEVAVEKVSPIIQTVAKHLFAENITKSELPNPSTVQVIVDEGHFLAKKFIAEKINKVDNWGLGRDGTTRRKEKILDTSVTLDTGDVISLGFNRVANETAETINNITKRHIEELGTLHNPSNESEYVANALQKLSFTMSDRASNEKKADRLLDEWRDNMLEGYEGDTEVVHHFHCMAHVLLGFHSYCKPEIKQLETEIVETDGPIGRDNLSVFRTWGKKETFPERAVRTTADVFGPCGEHIGVRDRWDAYTSEKGIKSLIGNYRDNRFNALFQTAAEVFFHKNDFIHVLKTVKTPNLKLKAVLADLESNEVMALLQCLGLFYIKLTGPYWNLSTSGKVPYLEVYKHVQDIHTFLQKVEESPEHLLVTNEHWSVDDPLEIRDIPHHALLQKSLFTIQEDTRDLLLKSIPKIAQAMSKVVLKQLGDFLHGGKFAGLPNGGALHRTKFAPITNLGCEHHFGDLDSSQRRRPHASYHHHSSIQLLKRNRTQLMDWVKEMAPERKHELLSSARKGGRELRQTHMQNEKEVLKNISQNMAEESAAKERKQKRDENKAAKIKESKSHENKSAKTKDNQSAKGKNKKSMKVKNTRKRRKVDEVRDVTPVANEPFTLNEYVAVAYQDNWYPGYIETVLDAETAVVKFMSTCRKPGYFQWPTRDDKQTVKVHFVVKRNFVPDCVASGRQYYVKDYSAIDTIYQAFHSEYF